MTPQRTIPPTAAPLPFGNLLCSVGSLWGGKKYRARLVSELKAHYAVRAAFLVSSGKAALTVILKSLAGVSERRQVIIPAYTCFSVPSAVVKAELEVVLCDVDPNTLDFNFTELEGLLNANVLCVVSTHLFGRPADTERVKQLCGEKGILVVEDAAQAMGGQAGDRLLGTIGDVGFYSLGRGKNMTCGTGGIILTSSAPIAEAIEAEYANLPETPWFDVFRNWLELLVMRIFIHPVLYWFPVGLPFLGLGETKFYTDFQMFRMDDVRAHLLDGWQRRLGQANQDRSSRARWLVEGLDFVRKGVQPIMGKGSLYLRLPVLVRDRKAKEVVCRLSREQGAGLSPNYPATVQDILELAGQLAGRRYPGAQEVVDRLVTLPTHQFVSAQDRLKIEQVLAAQVEPSVSSGTVKAGPPHAQAKH
ncbi:DegT/DnrJ/EryC1/StrS family aminotransferase [Nitrospira lenta]|uniref:Putative Aminotransferase n=1 Tax=Nitrospira lenta TaxID=1436998 RepID=A0A330L8Y5_9BACT|nr:DegT/DnrJ/EryC1/StrS family aminotransferase [Nitrospira lenta]SPP66150.1 putative Aminotransferase [Nitrospira lenta]